MSRNHRFLSATLLSLLLLAPFTYSWRVDYICYRCPHAGYYESGVDQIQFIFSELDANITGFDIYVSQGQNNESTYRTAVLGLDVPPTTYRTVIPADLSTRDDYYINVQLNTSTSEAVMGPLTIQSPDPTTSSSTASSTSSPTESTDTSDDDSKSNTGTIAGAVVGSVGGIALIIGAVFFARRRKRDQAQEGHAAHNLINDSTDGGSPPPQQMAPPPQQMANNKPGQESYDMQYAPTPVVAYPTDPQQAAPPQKEHHSIKPDGVTGLQYQGTSPQPQYQSPHVPNEPPAPPYRFQNPHEQSNKAAHSH